MKQVTDGMVIDRLAKIERLPFAQKSLFSKVFATLTPVAFDLPAQRALGSASAPRILS